MLHLCMRLQSCMGSILKAHHVASQNSSFLLDRSGMLCTLMVAVAVHVCMSSGTTWHPGLSMWRWSCQIRALMWSLACLIMLTCQLEQPRPSCHS
jgi:hypothetical protein